MRFIDTSVVTSFLDQSVLKDAGGQHEDFVRLYHDLLVQHARTALLPAE